MFETKLVEFDGVLRMVSSQDIGWYRSGIEGSSHVVPLLKIQLTMISLVIFLRKNAFLKYVALHERKPPSDSCLPKKHIGTLESLSFFSSTTQGIVT